MLCMHNRPPIIPPPVHFVKGAAKRSDAPHDWKVDDQTRCLTDKGEGGDQIAFLPSFLPLFLLYFFISSFVVSLVPSFVPSFNVRSFLLLRFLLSSKFPFFL